MTELSSSNPKADAAMERYALGDDSAFADLYEALAPRLYAFVFRKLRDVARAEDLVQQTLLQLHCARGRFVVGSWVTPWAFAIIRRLYLDQVRRKQVVVLTRGGEISHEHPSDHQGPEEFAHSRELEERLRQALTRLSPPQQAAFELVYFGHMSHAEAAAVLDVSVASVKLRVQRANQVIRASIEDQYSGDPNA
ncbi:MAG TPA: RNA polymerase sigma factor [Polyangiaceae bacterium]|nr:RNA polymerase sigma factor [Polyangiaceae bacterium]